MKSAISVLPQSRDHRLPYNLPNTPQVRILFQSPPPRRSTRPRWKAVSLLAAAGLLIFGASYITSAPEITAVKLASLPDYARYQWAGFHRTGVHRVIPEARVPLRGNWV